MKKLIIILLLLLPAAVFADFRCDQQAGYIEAPYTQNTEQNQFRLKTPNSLPVIQDGLTEVCQITQDVEFSANLMPPNSGVLKNLDEGDCLKVASPGEPDGGCVFVEVSGETCKLISASGEDTQAGRFAATFIKVADNAQLEVPGNELVVSLEDWKPKSSKGGWTVVDLHTISGTVEHADTVFYKAGVITGATYRAMFIIEDYEYGSVRVSAGWGGSSKKAFGNGPFVKDIVAGDISGDFAFRATTEGFSGTITDISLRRVYPRQKFQVSLYCTNE